MAKDVFKIAAQRAAEDIARSTQGHARAVYEESKWLVKAEKTVGLTQCNVQVEGRNYSFPVVEL